MKTFSLLDKTIQKDIFVSICEFSPFMKQQAMGNKTFQNFLWTQKFPIKLYRDAVKNGDFEDWEEFIDNICFRWEETNGQI